MRSRLRLNTFSSALLVLSFAAGAARADVVGSGHVVDETRMVGDFTGIAVSAGIQVKVTAGNRGPLALRGDDNVLPHVKTEIKGSTLRIGFEEHIGITTHEPVVVSLSAPRLEMLSSSGGSQLDASTPAGDSLRVAASGGSHIHVAASVKSGRLDLEASGAGEVVIDEIETGDARIVLTGASTAKLAGKAKTLDLELSGAGNLAAGKLTVSALKVNGSGGSHGKVHVVGPAQGTLSGGSSLRVGPDASVDVDASGGSEVSR